MHFLAAYLQIPGKLFGRNDLLLNEVDEVSSLLETEVNLGSEHIEVSTVVYYLLSGFGFGFTRD